MKKHTLAITAISTAVIAFTTSISAQVKNSTTANDTLAGTQSLPTLQVYAPHSDFGTRSSQMSAIEVPVAQIKAIPTFFGEADVMKALQKLPGVQSSSDGQADILVRGGDYDQNLITLDGSPLYNASHLKGFVSAINTEIIDNVIFYKGAFPARYGSRLSSVVDISMTEGDIYNYHGSLSIGMLSSKLHIDGPIIKGRTSFNLSGRLSYFDIIAIPLLKKVYDREETLQPFASMNFYDINAKLVHRFSDNDKLSASFYMGHDVNDTDPTSSHSDRIHLNGHHINNLENSTENSWGNFVSCLFWTHRFNEQLSINTNLNYSRYNYRLKMAAKIDNRISKVIDLEETRYTEDSYSLYHSSIDDLALTIDLRYKKSKHDLRWGIKGATQKFLPTVDAYKLSTTATIRGSRREEKTELIDTVIGSEQSLKSISLYAEDDWNLCNHLKANLGLRYSLFAADGKTYHSFEPRASVRFLFNDKMAVKLSYSRMAQAVHLLSSSNLVMPSDLWITATENVPLLTSNQWAVGYNYSLPYNIDFSIEGYYKTMNNLLEYREGSSYLTTTGDWQSIVALGKGRSYGVELLLQRKVGKTTGWISYTWAKSLRKFDAIGQEISSGREFYAGNDRRHNFNIVVLHRLNKHWQFSAAWTYQSGRRGNIATTAIYGGKLNENDPYGDISSGDMWMSGDTHIDRPNEGTYFDKLLMYYSYPERNGFVLPSIHRLDIGVNFTLYHRRAQSVIGLSIYNLYNRQNVTNVYVGYDANKTVLKGICIFPFMPSLQYTLKF